MSSNEDNTYQNPLLPPTREDPLVIWGDIEDGGNALNPFGVLGIDPEHVKAEEAALAASVEMETMENNSSRVLHLLGNAWNSSWGKWVLLGVLAAIVAMVAHSLASHSSKASTSSSQNITPAQAAVAQAQLNQQLAQESQALQSAGYSSQSVLHAQNQVALEYGTQIALATVNSNPAKDGMRLYVTGAYTPTYYTSLETLNTKAYVSSLSRSPTMSDITKNSAAIHGLSTIAAQ